MKKGFTLVEIIGVLVLMAAIALISVPIVEKQIVNGKEKAYQTAIRSIELATQNWFSDNVHHDLENDETVTIMFAQLKQGSYIDLDAVNPKTKEYFCNDMLIKIKKVDDVLKYEVLTDTGVDRTLYDYTIPTIKINGHFVEIVNLGGTYNDMGVTSSYDAITTGSVDTNTIGSYNITYSVTDNGKTNYLIRTVIVKDTEAPIVTIPSEEITIYDNEIASSSSSLNNILVTDNSGSYTTTLEGNLTTVPGVYTVTYVVSDSSNNVTRKARKVTVLKSGKPIFTFNSLDLKISAGINYDLLKGVSARDVSGNIVSNITCKIGTDDCTTTSLTEGTYVVTYTAKDSKNNTTTVTRNLIVESSNRAIEKNVNEPELYTNMLPIKYNGTNWVVADNTTEWYDYDNKEWANAVILNSGVTKTVGNTVLESEIALWFVWIPRYKYTIFNGNDSTATVQEINVVFEKNIESTGTVTCRDNISSSGTSSEICSDSSGSITNGTSTYTHPAFCLIKNADGSCNDSNKIKGFWMAKFEISGSTDAIKVVPNANTIANLPLGTFYSAIANISTIYSINANSYMMKNMEWGAIAYLKQSKYGLGTTDIGINNYYNEGTYHTGCGTTAGSAVTTTCEGNKYNENGVIASTTGNIYGVYDMSGGAYEYVSGNMVNSSGSYYSGSSNISTIPTYCDVYTYNTNHLVSTRGKLGDATKETLETLNSDTGGWYGDYASFAYSTQPWFRRGSYYSDGTKAGIFFFSRGNGSANANYSTRFTLTK